MMFNFLESFHDTHDKQLIKSMINEMIDLYGQPCLLLKRDNENSIDDDPLYNDSLSISKRYYGKIPTKVYIDYKNFAEILYSWGHTRLQNEHLYGIMKEELFPDEGDVIIFLRPYDGKLYTFELTSTDNWKEVCFNVVMTVIYQDVRELFSRDLPLLENISGRTEFSPFIQNFSSSISNIFIPIFSQSIGNDKDTEFIVSHNLATRDLIVQVYSNLPPYNTVLCNVERISTNDIKLVFDVPPKENEFRVLIIGKTNK